MRSYGSYMALLPTAAATDWSWTATSQNQLCAGIINNPSTRQEATAFAIGPCGQGGAATGPSAYLQSEVVGLSYVDEDTYLTCASRGSCAADMKVISGSGLGYRDYDVVNGADGTKFGYTMTGNVCGDLDTVGGYVGVASYLNTGTKEIRTKTNRFYAATPTGPVDRVARGASNDGAPAGPFTGCITEATNGACDGPDRVFKPSEFKFSVFGYLSGSSYNDTVVAGQNGFPAGMDHFGLRVKLSTVGFDASDLKVNNRTYTEAQTGEDVTSLSFAHERGGLHLDFPTQYNIGSVGSMSSGVDTVMDVEATKTIKIKVHGADSSGQFVYIDYLFETAGMGEGKYFIYDPTIQSTEGDLDTGTISSGAATQSPAAMAAITLAGCAVAFLV
jgi:hypothetical protein